jgi:fido (protein-threonine AMPylation protein)
MMFDEVYRWAGRIRRGNELSKVEQGIEEVWSHSELPLDVGHRANLMLGSGQLALMKLGQQRQ